ncbi:hypothetical protein [Marinicauda salina]|uniref:hypothetical protein n=1 Tax=Marinicauda salina TaxID=2135793 RepID=UPI001304AE61|nr:hypothetical protein [Marinicauda salina]
MNAAVASGLQGYQAAAAQFAKAADRIANARASTIPDASKPGAETPGASAGGPIAPHPSSGGRVSSSSPRDVAIDAIEAAVVMMRANRAAAAAATSIRAADDLVGQLLDAKA